MGFCGKPSTACYYCRQKRLKCSRGLPSCKQCLRKGIKCIGYIDPDALRIRDETVRVTKKLQKSMESSSSPSTTSRPARQDPSASHITTNPFKTATIAASPARDSYATVKAFFLSFHISGTLYDTYLHDICKIDAEADDACSYAVAASAYAAYAKHTRSESYLVIGQQNYVEALSRLNHELENPQKAAADRTLVTTMLLAMFELINLKAGDRPTAWINHSLGTVELLKHRRNEHSGSYMSRLILGHALLTVRTMHVLTLKVIPTNFTEFVRSTERLFDPLASSTLLNSSLDHLTRLGIDIKGNYDCLLFLQPIDIERQVAEFSKSLFSVVLPCIDDFNSWDPQYQLLAGPRQYSKSLRFARMWNTVNLMRISLTKWKISQTVQSAGFTSRESSCGVDMDTDSEETYVQDFGKWIHSVDMATSGFDLAEIPSFLEYESRTSSLSP